MTELRYTKDGVPIFCGSPELFVAYQRAALVYTETVEWKKRSVVGPRLQAALEGSARLAVEHMPPGWISHPKGASQLLDCLKRQIRSPTLAEAGRTMARFFYGIKRRRGEGMAAWIVRHDEALLEAKRTLAEAIQEYGPGRQEPEAPWSGYQRPPSRTGGQGGHLGERGDGHEPTDTPADTATETADLDPDREVDDEAGDWDRWSSWSQGWWPSYSDTWSWGYNEGRRNSWSSWNSKESLSKLTWDASDTASAQAEKFLPDFVIAWLLLQRSGLDSTEKSVITANLKNNFVSDKVKEALKLTWPDEELKKRDAGKHLALFTSEESAMMADDDGEASEAPDSWEDPEDEYAYQALEEEAHEALAALQDARRTLRDAREKQAQMRRNRNFFSGKGSGRQSTAWKSSASRPPPKCFKCGGPHFRRDCPEKGGAPSSEQQVNLVFLAEQMEVPQNDNGAVEPARATEFLLAAEQEDEVSLMALSQVLREGKAIIDGGATSSLGSEDALQQIATLNWQQTGDDGIEILPGETPSFRFGNNGRHDCMASALLRLPLGSGQAKMKVHLHDIPQQPVLLGIKGLRALGAVIDFSSNEAIFKNVDAAKIVTLETTPGGHQLFPLVADVLSQAKERRVPFRSLYGDEPENNPATRDE